VLKQLSKHLGGAVKWISFGSVEPVIQEQPTAGIGHNLPMTREMLNELLRQTPSLPVEHEKELVHS
jgi:hypothetical protein